MIERTIDDLAGDLRDKRMRGETAPALLLGAGAPLGAGIPSMRELMPAAFQCNTFEEFCKKIGPLTDSERFLRLFDFLQARGPDPFQVTPGFRSLGAMIAEIYFDLVLTTNFDPLLEDALATGGLRRKHYLLLVNPLIQSKWFDTLLADRVPRVKLVKLHGDFFHRVMAWTPEEMEDCLAEVGPKLANRLADRDLIVVGHSLADSPRIRALAESVLQNRALWFVNPGRPPGYIEAHRYVRAILGEDGKFETFFPKLAAALNLTGAEPVAPPTRRSRETLRAPEGPEIPAPAPQPPPPAGPSAATSEPEPKAPEAAEPVETIDDLMGSIVGIAANRRQPQCTGFVLRDPHVIISDGFTGRHAFDKESVDIVTPDGRRLKTRTRRIGPHPFGPWVLDAPKELHVPGLRVDATQVSLNLPIRVAVAAGTKVGISSGFVRAVEAKIPIAPLPAPVENLARLEIAVAPGSAGAPVVDTTLAVRGFIVAGSPDFDKPDSYMYPARHWQGDL